MVTQKKNFTRLFQIQEPRRPDNKQRAKPLALLHPDTSTDGGVFLCWDCGPHVSTPFWYFTGKGRKLQGSVRGRKIPTTRRRTIAWIISTIVRSVQGNVEQQLCPPWLWDGAVFQEATALPSRAREVGAEGGEEGKKKITCSQECSALLWVSGGKCVAGGMKIRGGGGDGRNKFEDCLCCAGKQRQR